MSLEFAKIFNLINFHSFMHPDVRNIRWEQDRTVENTIQQKRIKCIFRIENEFNVFKAKWSQVIKGWRFTEYHFHFILILNSIIWIEFNFLQERKLLTLLKYFFQVKNVHSIARFNVTILILTFLINYILYLIVFYPWEFKRNQLLPKDLDNFYH